MVYLFLNKFNSILHKQDIHCYGSRAEAQGTVVMGSILMWESSQTDKKLVRVTKMVCKCVCVCI